MAKAKRNPASLVKTRLRYEGVVLDGAARMLWVLAYMEFAESHGRCEYCAEMLERSDNGDWVDYGGGDGCAESDDGEHHPDPEFWPRAGSGEDWGEIATTPHGEEEGEVVTPAVAYACARAFLQQFAARENATIADLFEVAMTVHQGDPFEWYEDGDDDSGNKRKRQNPKLEAAEAFGAGMIAQSLGTGIGWGDNHKTRRGGAVFEPRVPRTTFNITGVDDVSWEVEGGGRGSDTIDRHVSIAGDVIAEGYHDERRFDDEEMAIEALTHASVIDETIGLLRQEGGESMEAVVVRSDPERFRAFYRSKDRVPGRVITLHLSGCFPIEREWVNYLYTSSIGRIRIVNPDNFGYNSDGDLSSIKSVLFWFGTSSPTYLLAFEDSEGDAFDTCVDWIEEWAPGHLVDEEVEEAYRTAVRDYLIDASLPDESMVSERVLSTLRDEAEEGTVSGGNHSRRLRSTEVGIRGTNLSLEELRQIGFDGYTPPSPSVTTKKATVNPSTRATVIPFATRPTSAASRSRR